MALLHSKNFSFFYYSHPYFSKKLLQRSTRQINLFYNLEFSTYLFIFSFSIINEFLIISIRILKRKTRRRGRRELYNSQRDDITRFKRNHCVAVHVAAFAQTTGYLSCEYFIIRLHLDFRTRNMVMQAWEMQTCRRNN